MTEEHKQHLRESALRRFAAMDEKKRAAFNAKCAAGGRKSWAVRSAADKAAQIARINTPEVRKRASDANKAMHQAKTEEERAAYSARYKARWLHPTESVEAERRDRSERAKRAYAALSEKEKRARMKKTAKANNVPVIATPVSHIVGCQTPNDRAVRRFESMKAAAAWIVKEGLGRSLTGAQHTICEVCCGRRETAYGFLWRRA